MFKKTIFLLLVEDDDDIIKLIKGILKSSKVKIYVSKTGEDAIDIIKTKNIDIALVDYKLPYKNGILITNEIREIKGDIPIILETGEKMLCENSDMTKEFRFDDVICKPFDKEMVMGVLKKYIK
jgi:DNA-binding response OmpR family regulator